ncbi:MAG: aminotransferase class IV [Candidatus Omnitrophota bacterium]
MPEGFSPASLLQDGIFETLRSENRVIVALEEHLERLFESAHALRLSLGYSRNELKKLLKCEVRSKPYPDAYVRIAFLREGDLMAEGKVQLFLIVKEAKRYPSSYYQKGVSIRTSSTRRNLVRALDAQAKVSDYVNGLLATVDRPLPDEAFEEIYLDDEGRVTEGRVSNLFMMKEGVLFTSPLFLGVLKGVTRGQVLTEAQKLKIPVREEPFTRTNLYGSDEVFLTNTSMRVMPVVSVDGRIIGNGTVGKTTKTLMKSLLSRKGDAHA